MESPRVAIVDQVFAARHWPGDTALGKTIRLGGEPFITIVSYAIRDTSRERPKPPISSEERFQIVGIVPTIRLYGYAAEPRLPQVYVPARQLPPNTFVMVVRGRGSAAEQESAIRQAVRQVDSKVPVAEMRTLEERVSATFATSRLYTFLLAIFAALALLLAAVGLYGVLAYQVSRRRREFGIRLALGALSSQVSLLVLRRGILLIGAGSAIGLAGAVVTGRLLSSLLYRTGAFDALVVGSVLFVLLLVALAASWLPARRAARVAPIDELRA
jgi:hypothetical protein